MKYKKTERIYTPVESMAHFATKIGKFGDRTAYRYFDRQHNLHSLTYKYKGFLCPIYQER